MPSIFDGSAAATASDGESDATATTRTADGVREKRENVFASARRFLSRAVGSPSVKLSRRLRGARGIYAGGVDDVDGEASLVVFGREMLDGELTLSVSPDLCVGVSLTPFENAKAFLEAGVDEFGETDRSTSASLDAAESAFACAAASRSSPGAFLFREPSRTTA